MELRGVFVFRHEHQLGNAHAGRLFERLSVQRKDGARPPRAFADYTVALDEASLPEGISVYCLL